MGKRYVTARGAVVPVLLSVSLARDTGDRPAYVVVAEGLPGGVTAETVVPLQPDPA